MRKYQVVSLDVWAGEGENGWDKNNFFKIGEIEVPEDFKDKDIWKALKKAGLSPRGDGTHLKLEDFIGSGDYLEIFRKRDLYPILDLVAVV
jgi:hypothetical protein